MAVATNTLQVIVYDIRQLHQPIDIRDSRLGYTLRPIHMLPNEKGNELLFVIDDRICSWEYRRTC